MTLSGSQQLIWQGPTAYSHPNDPNVFGSLTFYSLKWITITMYACKDILYPSSTYVRVWRVRLCRSV